ncbi:ribosomal-protein-alanine N-acetyltransferase [Arsukibacterium tuosuense]|uniref:Ribosomal-protein-alanine N-acetyltransferase n=1 Tax=Arsukibacterium tuosuense TaxID=1323745 RepID=A0A285I3Q5_9GAMM|nr:GNAT family protein [Arsukibacterium tuosuense]SNY42615.1 ribosomal-protein-alanine N-acetyltransferase [Arsukibacterium tuosuense]
MTFPALKTERLLLSELQDDDKAEIFELFSNPSVVEYYDLAVFTEPGQAGNLISLFKSRYAEQAGIRWAIRLKATGNLIGTCGFNSWNSKMQNAVIGYDLLPAFWGKSYSSEAVRAIIEIAFSGKLACGTLHRIQADTVPGNNASEALLLRLGFKEEGLRRECGYWKNKFHDLKCFGLLRSEFISI